MPMLYNTRYSSKRRVTVMIAVVWVLSFAISCPLLFGLNTAGELCHLQMAVGINLALLAPQIAFCYKIGVKV